MFGVNIEHILQNSQYISVKKFSFFFFFYLSQTVTLGLPHITPDFKVLRCQVDCNRILYMNCHHISLFGQSNLPLHI